GVKPQVPPSLYRRFRFAEVLTHDDIRDFRANSQLASLTHRTPLVVLIKYRHLKEGGRQAHQPARMDLIALQYGSLHASGDFLDPRVRSASIEFGGRALALFGLLNDDSERRPRLRLPKARGNKIKSEPLCDRCMILGQRLHMHFVQGISAVRRRCRCLAQPGGLDPRQRGPRSSTGADTPPEYVWVEQGQQGCSPPDQGSA